MRRDVPGRGPLLLCLLGMLAVGARGDEPPRIAGYVEIAALSAHGIRVHAKLDTGAADSSINARDVQKFERDGRTWVRFDLTNRDGRSVVVEQPLVGQTRIRRHEGEGQTRDVIELGICLDDVYREVRVSLVDRSRFDYQLLVGRSFLEGAFLVDPAATYLNEPRCRETTAR